MPRREEYGVDILRVQEIRGHRQPTRIAGAPEFIGGVLNPRCVIVPIVDLQIKFGSKLPFATDWKKRTLFAHSHQGGDQVEGFRTDNVINDQRTPLVIA